MNQNEKKNIRKLTIAGVLVAVAVVGSLFSIPVFGAKCSPVQHMVNVLGAVLLGPGYAVGMWRSPPLSSAISSVWAACSLFRVP